jgi:hypothetical protein
LSVAEWKAILDRYEKRTERIEKINTGYDDIAEYARSKFHSRIAAARRLEDGAMAVRLAGKAEAPLRLSVFDEREGVPERRYVTAEPFDGRLDIRVTT